MRASPCVYVTVSDTACAFVSQCFNVRVRFFAESVYQKIAIEVLLQKNGEKNSTIVFLAFDLQGNVFFFLAFGHRIAGRALTMWFKMP